MSDTIPTPRDVAELPHPDDREINESLDVTVPFVPEDREAIEIPTDFTLQDRVMIEQIHGMLSQFHAALDQLGPLMAQIQNSPVAAMLGMGGE